MGGTSSRSASMTCDVMPVRGYSKLVRVSDKQTVGKLLFRDLFWDIYVHPAEFDKDGLAELLHVSVVFDFLLHRQKPPADISISIEILDETGEHTVFRKDSSWREEETHGIFVLAVMRRELEASSCVPSYRDCFTVRCTLKKKKKKLHATKPRRLLLGGLSKSNAVLAPPQVAMSGCHTLTVRSVSKMRAKLRNSECTYSTHFVVGGSTWYLNFCPQYRRPFLCLGRVGNNETPMTMEFSFQLQGVVSIESQKMRYTFHRADDTFYYHLEKIETLPSQDDRLVVRCCLAVVIAEDTPIVVPMCNNESLRTPLLSAMHR